MYDVKYLSTPSLARFIRETVYSTAAYLHKDTSVKTTDCNRTKLQILTMALIVVLVLSLISQCWSTPYRRNWTPQAILYLKGAQGHRSIVERSSREDTAALPDITYNQSSDELKISSSVSLFLQRLMEQGGGNPYEELYLL